MNKNLLLFTSVLLFLGLFGVGVVQIFWLKDAISSREQEFDKAVFDAMNDVSVKIEDLSFHPLLSQMIQTNRVHTNENGELVVEMYNSYGNENVKSLNDGSAPVIGNYGESNLLPSSSYGQLPADENYPPELANMRDFLAHQVASMQPIADLLDTTKLREIVCAALKAHGIKTRVHYGVTEYDASNFVLMSKNAPIAELTKTPYAVGLFKRSMFDESKTLRLYLPDRKKYLYSSMSPMVLSSLVFFLMVVAAFILSFQIIFRQKKLSDMKTDFINNMTHELKTPIATISIASEMLKDNFISESAESRTKYAGIIFEENKRLYNNVEQVLQIARLEKGELQLNLEDRDIHAMIPMAVNRFNLILEELNGRVELHLDAQHSVLKLDEMHFNNVLNNLIDNAIKYNKKEPQVIISTQDYISGIQIEVQDNGVGLSKEDQQKIFEQFYRVAKGNVHDTKGFGLGLSYVKSIVEKHNGKIWVESKLKEGSKFIIQLPFTT